MKKAIVVILITLTSLFSFWLFYLRNYREHRLMTQGQDVLMKIEKYRYENGRLPDSLAQVGFREDAKTDLEIEYTKKDSTLYVLWLGISSEESKFYYSDSGKWEDSYREMK